MEQQPFRATVILKKGGLETQQRGIYEHLRERE
jgi:hypothetical protein